MWRVYRKFPLQQQVALVVRQNCYNNVCGLETHYVINNELFFLKRRKTEKQQKSLHTFYSPQKKSRLIFNYILCDLYYSVL